MSTTEIALPVRRVVAYEDRAAFEREGPVSLPGGPVTFEIAGISPVVSDAHLSAALLDAPAGAAVEDLRIERRWVVSGGAEPARLQALERQIEAAADARFAAEQARDRATERAATAARELARYAEGAARAAFHGVDAEAVARGLDALEAGLCAAHAALDAARRDAHEKVEAEKRVQVLLAACRSTTQVQQTVLCVRVAGPAGAARLLVRGLYPCALWRPSHEAHLRRRPDGALEVEFTAFATLWQRTGEDWRGVELTFSTARPGARAELPGLSADRLRIRDRAPKPKVTQIAHRAVAAARAPLGETVVVPGVYDGGEPRAWRAPAPLDVPSDGRPYSVALDTFRSAATAELTALPEVSSGIFLRARLHNAQRPLLAGPVTLLRDGARIGTGDLSYVGPGEPFELSFGTDDRLSLTYRRRTETEERLLGRDRPIYVHEVELHSLAGEPVRVELCLALPVSELSTVKVVPSERHCTEGLPKPDADGRVSLPIDLQPRRRRTVRLGFGIDSGPDTQVPPPW